MEGIWLVQKGLVPVAEGGGSEGLPITFPEILVPQCDPVTDIE